MAEEKKKKLRLYKLASEINLSTDTLTEFLESKGHKIKSVQSIITDEMLTEIYDHFKKDIEKSEKHKKHLTV